MRSMIRKVALLSLVCAVLLSPLTPAAVQAAGYENIGGNALYQQIRWFYTDRSVTYPPTPGPEVAFYLRTKSSPFRLFLGTHDCYQGGAGPMYEQFYNSWQPVAYYSAPTNFCLWSYSPNGSGTFNGDLAWD